MAAVTRDVTMADLKLTLDSITIRLATTATKADITQIDDKVTAQNMEFQQIKMKLTTQEDNIRKLQNTVDECVAANLVLKDELNARQTQAPVRDLSTNMAAPIRKTVDIARRNLIIEGLPGEDEEAIYANFLKITSAIKVIIYKSDIEGLSRLPRRDRENRTPGPVLVTMTRAVLRDNILKNKAALMEDPDMTGVFINADETKEVKIAKSILRKKAYNAKQDNVDVEYRHNRVRIAETWYTTEDIEKLPVKYSVANKNKSSASGGQDLNQKEPEAKPVTQTLGTSQFQLRKGEKIRLTKAGLLFSGATAFPSNMFYAPIKVGNIEHDCNEQSYQYDKAKDHGFDDLAEEIRGMDEPMEMKKATKKIKTTEEWKSEAPDKLWDLISRKYNEHPVLLERLISTAPYPLVEASVDSRWVGGAPFNSEKYDDDTYPGNNDFGKMSTKFRDRKIKQRAAMS